MEKYFALDIYGEKAVSVGYKVNDGMCYSLILDGLGQMEVTVDEEGTYKGFLNKWVTVSYIKRGKDIPAILDELARLGFKGCYCSIDEECINGCFASSKTLCWIQI